MIIRTCSPSATLILAATIVACSGGGAIAQTAVSLTGQTYTYDNAGTGGSHVQAMGSLTINEGGDSTVRLFRTDLFDVSLQFTGLLGHSNGFETGRSVNFVTAGTPGVNGVDSKIVFSGQNEYRFRQVHGVYFNGGDFAVYDMAGGGGLTGFVRGIRYGVDLNSRTSGTGTTLTSNATAGSGSIYHQEVTGDITAQGSVTIGATTSADTTGTLKLASNSNITLLANAQLTVTGAGNAGNFGILKTGGGTSTINGGANAKLQVFAGAQSTWRVDSVSDVLDVAVTIVDGGTVRWMKTGQGTLRFSRDITWSGDHRNKLDIAGGTVEIGGNALHQRTNSSNFVLLRTAATRFLYSSTNEASTMNGEFQGLGVLEVTNGILSLTRAAGHSFSGGTSVSGGTLLVKNTSGNGTGTGPMSVTAGRLGLDYTAAAASKIADTAQLRLGGGTVELIDGTYTEVVGSTALVGGLGRIIRSSGTSVLRLNTVTPETGFVDFAADNIAQVDNANTNGILGPWATVAGTDWAVNSTGSGDGLVTAYSGYTDIDAQGSTVPDAAAANVRIAGDGTTGPITLGAATTTIHTLLQGNGTTAATIDTTTGTLALAGVMVGTGRQPLTIGAAAGDGSLQSASAAANLTLANYGSAGPLTVNAPIAANGGAGLVTAGDVVLAGNSSYTGPTVVNAGTLQVGTGGGTGSLSAETAISGLAGTRLDVNRSDTLTLGSATGGGISGGIGLRVRGGGRLILGGTNTYTGATQIDFGSTLQIGAGLAAGSLSPTSPITNEGTLVFNRSGTLTQGVDFAAAISGFGAVTQDGLGTTLLTGANTYFGSTTVAAGTLAVGPAGTINLTGDVLVTGGTFRYDNATTPLNRPVAFGGTGGTVAGIGRIATDLVISSGNTISPGNSPGILGTGNLTWSTGGNYNWQVLDATAAAGSGFDQISVTGSLAIETGFNLNLWSQEMISGFIFNGDAIFDNSQNQHWVIAATSGGLIGAENLASATIFTTARNGTGGFTNTLAEAGSFSLVQGGSLSGTTSNDVVLVYTVPEPGPATLIAGGILAGLLALRARAGRRR